MSKAKEVQEPAQETMTLEEFRAQWPNHSPEFELRCTCCKLVSSGTVGRQEPFIRVTFCCASCQSPLHHQGWCGELPADALCPIGTDGEAR
jgi:hypothetical protein